MPETLPGVAAARPIAGGSICAVWDARLTDGRRVVVKRTPYDAEVEADGLRALAGAGAAVPEILAVAPHVLVLGYVEGPPDWQGLGRSLSVVHRRTAGAFGWHRDNLIGSLPQDNRWHADWGTFYAERRIRPLLDAPALPNAVRHRLLTALDGPIQRLLDHRPSASLVHGDLWNGNVVGGRWLIDPAVHHADREFELAFMELFGGFPAPVTAGYLDSWPLPEGWRRRRPALQLYHLLVHVRLFGGGYVRGVADRLDALGW